MIKKTITNCWGFTLTELLISVFLLSIVIFVIITVDVSSRIFYSNVGVLSRAQLDTMQMAEHIVKRCREGSNYRVSASNDWIAVQLELPGVGSRTIKYRLVGNDLRFYEQSGESISSPDWSSAYDILSTKVTELSFDEDVLTVSFEFEIEVDEDMDGETDAKLKTLVTLRNAI